MKTRGFAILLAFALAAVATGAVFLYVQGVRQQSKTPTAVEVTVIVAKQDIAPGTRLDSLVSSGGFTTLSLPRDALVPGAITNLSQVQGETASARILQGEQITTARIQGTTANNRLGIDPGYQAITLQLSPQELVGGNIQPQDHVTLYVTIGGNSTAGAVTLVVVPDVKVLQAPVFASGTGTGLTGSSGGGNGGFITLELKPLDVAKVLLADQQSTLWMSLLRPDEQGTQLKPVTTAQLGK